MLRNQRGENVTSFSPLKNTPFSNERFSTSAHPIHKHAHDKARARPCNGCALALWLTKINFLLKTVDKLFSMRYNKNIKSKEPTNERIKQRTIFI